MTETATPLTLDELATQFAAMRTELDTLRHENARLSALVASIPTGTDLDDVRPVAAEIDTAPLERLSRRVVLRRAMQATAATVATGVLLQRDTQPADASHSMARIDANAVYAHYVFGSSEDGYIAIRALTNSDTHPANYGLNEGLGPGIEGRSAGNGVQGYSYNTNASGVYGENGNGNGGFGVAGDTTSAASLDLLLARAGVFGRNNGTGAGVFGLSVNTNGDGVLGIGKVGVHGTSRSGNGILGEGGSGYGGQFKGNRAQLRLAPTTRTGQPTTGAHQVGELYLDKTGSLFICTMAGTPGTWRKVSTTAT